MTTVPDFPLASALASALVHFSWQGLLVAAIVAFVWRLRLSPHARYAAGVTGLAAMLALPVLTTVLLAGRGAETRTPAAAASSANATLHAEPAPAAPASPVGPGSPGEAGRADSAAIAGASWTTAFRAVPPAVVLGLWAAGVLILSLRLAGGWVVARRLVTRGVAPVGRDVEALARQVARRLDLRRAVRVLESSVVAVPVMVGWLRPVILFPVSALSGLTLSQVEALLAHELAHVRRHDYLVNLLQSGVETLLFYHPAVWWMSRGVRREREHCCDDVALGVIDRLTYATALTDLAAMISAPRLALAATDGSLVDRVKRVLTQEADPTRPATGWLAALIVVVAATAVVVPTGLARSPASGPVEPGGHEAVDEQVAGGVRGGVTAGVAGGVSTGVRGGVEAGAEAGVGGGVEGGVTGGVGGGVTGGVVGGVIDGVAGEVRREASASQSASGAQSEAATRAKLQALLAAEIDLEQRALLQRYDVDRQRMELERTRQRSAWETELESLERELGALTEQRGRLERQVAIGLATESSVGQIERQVRETQLRLEDLMRQRTFIDQQSKLDQMEAEQTLARERQRLELLRQQREIDALTGRLADRVEQRRDAESLRRALDEKSQEAAEYERLLRQLQTSADAQDRLARGDRPDAPDQARPIATGDVIGIAIAGEPDLPALYPVSGAGTVRIPLLGELRVTGRTTAQVRDEIARVLRDRGLQAQPRVTVTIKQ